MATPSLQDIIFQVDVFARLQNAISASNVLADTDKVGFQITPPVALTTGTGANQADRLLYIDDATMLSGVTISLNMYSGANWEGSATEVDLLGNTLTLVDIILILIRSRSESVGTLLIGGEGTSAAWSSPFNGSNTAKSPCYPGGDWHVFAPTDPAYAVGGISTNHLLKLEASGGAVDFDAIAFGRSA